MAPNRPHRTSPPYNVALRPNNRSTRPREEREMRDDARLEHARPNHILRLKIEDPCEQTTTFLIYQLFSFYGEVVRIVLWNTDGSGPHHGMVEFALLEDAKAAKRQLNGFHMFGRCHTLQIEFSWTNRLNVTRNDAYTFDITQVLPYIRPQCRQEEDGNCCPSPVSYQEIVAFSPVPNQLPNLMIVTGLTAAVANTQKLFNLLSLYGNVARIQFIEKSHSQFGSALVEMFDAASVDCCIHYLNDLPVGTCARLSLHWADQNYHIDETIPRYLLNDASYSYEDFTQSKNQRFLIPRPSYWLQPPSRFVRFYNTPLETTRESICAIFSRQNIIIKGVKIFPQDDTARSQTTRGILEFYSLSEATHAIMRLNNKELESQLSGKSFMKLCYSSQTR